MSDATDTGGRAFPSSGKDGTVVRGMTLRDYFAAAAATGIASKEVAPAFVATQVYKIADAMIAVRNKTAAEMPVVTESDSKQGF